MRFRETSELGYLMLQWLGAIALPAVARDEVNKHTFRLGGIEFDAPNASAVNIHRAQLAQFMHWPDVESMLRGDPPMLPEEFERAALRAGVETGGTVIDVDREAGTVTVSGIGTGNPRPIGPRWCGCLPDEATCMTCGRLRQ